MAIIDLGTEIIAVGDLPVSFAAIQARQGRAYLFYGVFQVSNLNNIFSRLEVTVLLSLDDGTIFSWDNKIIRDINPGIFSFLVPLNSTIGEDPILTLQAERKPLVFGGGDIDAEVSLNMYYDNQADIRSWTD